MPDAPIKTGLWVHPNAPAAVSDARPSRVYWAYAHGGTDPAKFRRVADVQLERWPPRLVPSPRLRRHGIVGEPTRQFYGMGGPFLFYADFSRTCRDCRDPFVFRAVDQQHWYEEIGSFVDAAAVRCLSCRRRARAGRETQVAWQAALTAWDPAAPDAHAAGAMAEAAVALVEAGGGTARVLEQALGAVRRVARDGTDAPPLLGWCAVLEAARGRPEAALAAAEAFLGGTRRAGDGATKALRKRVERDVARARQHRRMA